MTTRRRARKGLRGAGPEAEVPARRPRGGRRVRLNFGFRAIALKKSENERSRKSRFHAPNVARAGHRHGKAYARATGGKTGRSAEPVANFSSNPPAAF